MKSKTSARRWEVAFMLFPDNHRETTLLLPKNGSSLECGPQANLVVMRPRDENRDDALIFTGIGSLFTAIAAVLLDYRMFATIFAFFSAHRGNRRQCGMSKYC